MTLDQENIIAKADMHQLFTMGNILTLFANCPPLAVVAAIQDEMRRRVREKKEAAA